MPECADATFPWLPLFVFGTLRYGHCNHHYLAGSYDRRLPATLRDYARVAELMIDRQPGAAVSGELFELTDSCYATTLAGCDDLEGIPRGQLRGDEYERRQVTVETPDGPRVAWAYVQPDVT